MNEAGILLHFVPLYLPISFRYETSERIGLLAGVQFPAHVADLPTLNASKCRTPIVGVIL